MGRIFAISKRMFLPRSLWTVRFSWSRHQPAGVAPSATSNIDYSVRGDHLFLPEPHSIKRHFTLDTLALITASVSLTVGLIYGLSVLLATPVLLILSGAVALFYFVFMVFKLYVISTSLHAPFITIPRERVATLKDSELPMYTVLVPLRDEADVMEQIIDAMESIDYPTDKLELIVTVEEFDHATKEAMVRCGIPAHWRVLELPNTSPKTKPKALNCAFLHVRGDYLVIYDAEIVPDADQLKKAIIAFNDHPEYGIVQPRLDHYNTYQNLLTRLFTIEFTTHYDLFLPGLARQQLPIPLSGHSTHFRTSALKEVGAWDPYNVAEDCEIGLRLFRAGYRSGVIDSVSKEEAASTLDSWIKQRTRWMKGFIQTTIVHLRRPVRTFKEMGGWRNFLAFLLIVPGTVAINLLNIFTFILLMIWLILQPAFIQTLYPLPILYLANFVAIVGGFVFVYLSMIALYRREKFDLVRWWFLIPVYWVLLAYATTRAFVQLITAPHLWEKTAHGTHLSRKAVARNASV